jgi:hypothetical protein
MEKVFLFFSTVSKRTQKGFITPDMLPPGPPRGAPGPTKQPTASQATVRH